MVAAGCTAALLARRSRTKAAAWGVAALLLAGVLPVAAVFFAAMINRELPNGLPSAIAIAGSLLSVTATVEALFQAHW